MPNAFNLLSAKVNCDLNLDGSSLFSHVLIVDLILLMVDVI